MPVVDVNGTDITDLTRVTAANAGIPHVLLVACMYGESKSFDPHSERWGTLTTDAQVAISRSDWAKLQQIITAAGNDISFGRCHRIVKYHWAGNQQYTAQNCLAVRQAVWTDPERDVREMASWLASDFKRAQAQDLTLVGGDVLLATCLIYNRGHEVVDPAEFAAITVRIINYRDGLAKAAELLSKDTTQKEETNVSDDPNGILETKAANGKLNSARWPNGEGIQPLPVVNLHDDEGNRVRLMWLTDGIALQADNGDTWEPSESNPQSFATVFAKAVAANPEPFKQAMLGLGFQLVPA